MSELEALLLLENLQGIGWNRSHKLLTHFGSATAIFKAKPKEWRTVAGLGEAICYELANWEKYRSLVAQQVEMLDRYAVAFLVYGSTNYPLPLSYCPDAPLLLFYQGIPQFKKRKIISIVGTRQNTPHGRAFCEQLVEVLSPYNPIICSGLARGIDRIAHQSALHHGLETVACLAHGLDQLYPPNHQKLSNSIKKRGAIVTDFLPEATFRKTNFPRRNRLIAGMAHATVVIESGLKVGSMNTANLAHQYGRELFAVPGRYSDYKSKGCHHLIVEQKAQLLSDPKQLLDALGWENQEQQKTVQKALFVELTPKEKRIVNELKAHSKIHLDGLALQTQQKISTTAALLLQLEMKGVVRALPGKYYERI